VLQRSFLRLPLPPAASPPVGARELGGAHLSPLAQAREHSPDLLRVSRKPGTSLLPTLEHESPVQTIVLDRDEAGRVRPVLEEHPLGQKLVQPARLVRSKPAPEHEIGAARDDGYGVFRRGTLRRGT
jgi:hypothetical protein